MEKLTRENIYIDLRGNSKEELTDLWELLDKAGENQYDDKENFINDNYYNILSLDEDNEWSLCLETSIMLEDKTEVTIQQLKEILQPMENKGEQLRKEAKERGYTHDNFRCLIDRPSDGNEDIDKWYYDELNDILYTMPYGQGGNVVYRDGVWAEIFSESLEQQLQKAKAEVKRLKDLINAKEELKRIQKLIESLENES